jgi:predicted nucleic acid-binding Zn ribbon protein
MSSSAQTWLSTERQNERRNNMGNIFYIIGVVVVVLFVLGYVGLR